MAYLKVSLEQWQAFVTIVQEGSYAQASKKLFKTQPTLSYLIKKLEDTLQISLFKQHGRTIALTPTAKKIYFYAIKLIDLAVEIEKKPTQENEEIEATIRLAVDEIYPLALLMRALQKFAEQNFITQIFLTRAPLSGPFELFEKNKADIAITYKYPHHCLADHLISLTSSLYAANTHPLHAIKKSIELTDLHQYRQIILMDSRRESSQDVGFLSPQSAWFVDSLEMKLQFLNQGLGYAWLNDCLVKSRPTQLKNLQLAESSTRYHSLYIAQRELGPAGRFLVQCLKEESLPVNSANFLDSL